MDYGFHAPTMSFPVAGTLMIEPTESESKAELDRFCEAMIAIREEIRAIEDGRDATRTNNPLKHAPHTAGRAGRRVGSPVQPRAGRLPGAVGAASTSSGPYVARIDNVYGDRHLVCACLPMEAYAQA